MSDDQRVAREDPHLPDPEIPNAVVNSQGEFCFVYGDRDIHESLPIEFPMLPPLGGTKPIEWLWPGRIPLGMVTFLEGAGGSGKTFVVLDMAARVTCGAPWPGKVHGPERTGDVLLVGGDPDGWERVIVPRLMSAGADLTRIGRSHTVDSYDPVVGASQPKKSRTKRPLSFPHDLPMIEYNIRLRPETRLVVIDPLSAFCADDQAYRATLRQLEEIAERRNVAIVVTARPAGRQSWRRPKEGDRRADAVRSVFRVLVDLEDDSLYHLAPVRTSFCAEPEWLPFRIGPKDAAWQPMVAWGPPAESPPESALPGSPARERSAIRKSVKEWLQVTLLKSDMPCQMMVKEATAMGFSKMTFRRAREALGVRMFRGAGGPLSACWWTLRPAESGPDIPPGGLPDEATLAKIQNWENWQPGAGDDEAMRVDEILREFAEIDAGLASASPVPPVPQPNGRPSRPRARSRRKRSSWIPEALMDRMRGAQAAAHFAQAADGLDSPGDRTEPGTPAPDANSSANGEHKPNGRRKRKPK